MGRFSRVSRHFLSSAVRKPCGAAFMVSVKIELLDDKVDKFHRDDFLPANVMGFPVESRRAKFIRAAETTACVLRGSVGPTEIFECRIFRIEYDGVSPGRAELSMTKPPHRSPISLYGPCPAFGARAASIIGESLLEWTAHSASPPNQPEVGLQPGCPSLSFAAADSGRLADSKTVEF